MDKEIQDLIIYKIDKIETAVNNIDKTLIRQEEQLAHHIKRTEIAEENITILRQDLRPVQDHVSKIEGVFKFIGLVSACVGVVAGLLKILSFFHL